MFFPYLILEPSRPRRIRDWNEEERRRRKEKMRLDIEKENMKSLTSPAKKTSPLFKQISPDDRTALNILDGTSVHKAKRMRPKTRRYKLAYDTFKTPTNLLRPLGLTCHNIIMIETYPKTNTSITINNLLGPRGAERPPKMPCRAEFAPLLW